jgi:hypothetical protein
MDAGGIPNQSHRYAVLCVAEDISHRDYRSPLDVWELSLYVFFEFSRSTAI